MSGLAPIGYELKEKKLLIDEEKANKVKLIFDKYLELRSVPALKQYLEDNGIKTKAGNVFSKGHLYRLLENQAYIGKIIHKGKIYEGEHEAIIDLPVFKEVQRLLTQNRIDVKSSINSKESSLLAGKLFDDKGNHMSPSHSNTRNRRYRYYVSQALIQARKHEAGSISKIPAGEIESLIKCEVKVFISDIKNIQKYIEDYDINKQKDLLTTVKKLQTDLKDKLNNTFIRIILSKVILYKDKLDIILCKEQLIKLLEATTYDIPYPEELKEEPKTQILITKKIRISATSNNGSVLVISDTKKQEPNYNSQLINAVAKSYYWNELIISEKIKSSTDILKIDNEFGKSYVNYILELRFLAPDIIEGILSGKQPRDLTLKILFDINTLDWEEQRKILNF